MTRITKETAARRKLIAATLDLVTVRCWLRVVQETRIAIWNGHRDQHDAGNGITYARERFVWLPRYPVRWRFMNRKTGAIELRLPRTLALDRGLMKEPPA